MYSLREARLYRVPWLEESTVSAPYDVMAPFHASISERDAALAQLRREDPVHWDAANESGGS